MPYLYHYHAPQDLKFQGEETKLEIGNNNKIREYVTINPGTIQGGGITKIGNNNLIMIGVHIAHDCIIKNNTILANQVTLGGHVRVDNIAVLGGLSAVHQFCRIGSLAMIGGMSAVENDIIVLSDEIYKDIDSWKARIKSIKDANPKS